MERLKRLTRIFFAGRKKWTLLVVLALVLVVTTGCISTRTDVIDTSCDAFNVITYSSGDTPLTKQQVREHNAAWLSVCSENLVNHFEFLYTGNPYLLPSLGLSLR